MAEAKAKAPYGSWKSPVSAADVASGGLRFTDLRADGEDLYWVERRATQHGIGVLVKRSPDGQISDVSPPSISVASTVHEYGGAPYAVRNGIAVVTSRVDNALWRIEHGTAQLLVNDGKRYADFVFNADGTHLIAVCEHHAGNEVRNSLVSISVDRGRVTPLAEGRDFYAHPRVSPDGKSLCWIAWDLPAMPWEWTELWRAEFAPDGSLGEVSKVLGSKNESLVQPAWSPQNELYVMADRTDFWNLYRVDGSDLKPVFAINEECAGVAWMFGYQSYHFLGTDEIVVASQKEGCLSIHRIQRGKAASHKTAHVSFEWTSVPIGTTLYLVAASPETTSSLLAFDLVKNTSTVVRSSSVATLDKAMRSEAKLIRFPREDGSKGFAYLYEPKNSGQTAQRGEKPPLLVRCHGGPTGSCSTGYSVGTQFWTTRGFAVLDVDYAGSSGYGRKERQRLAGTWGVDDVLDCVTAAQFVAESGKADKNRLLITGGSAGGYIVLCAMAFHPGVFAAGADYFGVADLALMQRTTHKYESGYQDFLLGSGNPDDPIYAERSPLTKVHQINKPLIVLQGLDDAVVPPSQADVIVSALRSREIPCAAYYFAHEGHGFRDSDNIITAFRAELGFYRMMLDIPSDDPIVIDVGEAATQPA